jgi:hypothetical protein
MAERRLNRILTAIEQWINSLVWWREGEVKTKPYTTIESRSVEGAGIVLLVRRNPEQCPRDVGTVIWLPARASNPGAKDCHILIDHLEGMRRVHHHHTHQVTIAVASHWPDGEGFYAYENLYVGTADLQGQQVRRDLNIRKILSVLAHPLIHMPAPLINWDLQMDIAMKSCGLNAPKATGTVIARSLDGGGGVRVKLD